MSTEFIELAGKVNQQMPYHCVAKTQRALNDRGLAVKGARVAVIGVSYKPGVGDIRESPALKIISLLRKLGAEVSYHDPHVPVLAEFALASSPLAELVANADVALIVTAHPSVDHVEVARRSRLTVDLRGVDPGLEQCERCEALSNREPYGISRRVGAASGRGRAGRRGRVLRRARCGARGHHHRRRLRDRGPCGARQASPARQALGRARAPSGPLELGAGVSVGAGAVVFAGRQHRGGGDHRGSVICARALCRWAGERDRPRERGGQRRDGRARVCGSRARCT